MSPSVTAAAMPRTKAFSPRRHCVVVMQAILLAGGFGTRLRPLTYTRPKPLLPVAGRPMMDWILDRVPGDVEEVTVAAQWGAGALRDRMEAGDWPFATRVVEEDEPLGSGGAVRHAAGASEEPLLVLNADIVCDMDLESFVSQHRSRDNLATIAVAKVPREDVVNFGVIRSDDQDTRRITQFVEKPATPELAPSRYANAGVYLLEPEAVDRIPGDRLVSLEKEIFPELLEGGLDAWHHDGLWIDVGDRTRMIAAHLALGGDELDEDLAGDVERSVVGPGTRIEAGAVVRDSVLGADVHVAADARLERCLVGDGERVGGEVRDERVWTREVPPGYPDKQVGNRMQVPT